MIFLLLFVSLLLGLSIYVIVVLARRLIQFDGFVASISEELDEYNDFLVRKTARGLLSDSPEVKEFHLMTMELIRTIDSWAKVWEKPRPQLRKSIAQMMSERPEGR